MAAHDKNEPRRKPSGRYEALLERVAPLAVEIESLQQEARRISVFAGDRELLECDHCGLREDVTAGGLLVTYVGTEPQEDLGVRFRESEDPRLFICPSCGEDVREPEGKV